MKCPKCGAELPKNAPQCPTCGTGIVRGKYCPHCRAVIPADAQTCPQCKKAIPAPRQKKPLTKRWWFWTVAAVLVLGIIGNVSSAINGGNGPQPEPSPSSASSLLETNPFLQPEVQVADVMNGVRTEKLGEWACIHMEKAEAKAAGEEAFSEFAKTSVQGSGYNWWSVVFEDGTGICFTGSHTYLSTYGKLDDEGCVTEALGDISLDAKTSRIIYTPRAEKPSPTPSPEPASPTPEPTKAPTPPPAATPAPANTPAPAETPAPDAPSATQKPSGGGANGVLNPAQPDATQPPAPSSTKKPSGGTNNFNTYDNPDQQQTTANYVLNTSTMKFHSPSCNDVKKIKPQNYSTFSGTREEAINAGYSPCGHCKP